MQGRISHPFDIALAVRGRRKQLRLRQSEVAQAAGVGREWLCDIEHGKPTAEMGKVLRVFEALGLELDVTAREPRADVDPAADDRRQRAPRAPRREPAAAPAQAAPGRDPAR